MAKPIAKKSKIFEIFKRTVMSPSEVVTSALQETIDEKPTPEVIKKNFSGLIEKLQKEAYSTYLEAQTKSGQAALKEYYRTAIADVDSKEKAIETVVGSFDELDRFFLSLSQSRKARAGSAFEDVIRTLFKMLYYPFDEQIIINGKPDFLMPGEKHYRSNPMDCLIFTAKRTLRERWRQIVTEGTRGLGFFLATIDDQVTETQLKEMKNNRIYLVVPSSMKTTIPHYKKAVNVLTFESFFQDHLDPAVQRWTRAKII